MIRKSIVAGVLLCLTALFAYADPADDLTREVGNLIQKAEKSFFAGNLADAQGDLDRAAAKLTEIRSLNPGHKSLNSLAGRHERLDKRVAEKSGQASIAARPAAPVAAASSAGGAQQLKPGAVQTFDRAGKELDAAEASLTQADAALAEKDFNKFASRLYKAEDHLGKAKELLDRAGRSYRVEPSHPLAVPFHQRHADLEQKTAAAKKRGDATKGEVSAAQQAAQANSAAVAEKWLPRINAFIRPGGANYIDFPMAHDPPRLAEQDRNLDQARSLLMEFDQEVAEAAADMQLQKAARDLRSAIENYTRQRNAGVGDVRRVVEDELAEWEKRFAENKQWQEDSGRSLFIVRADKFQRIGGEIDKLKGISPAEADTFSKRLTRLQEENQGWVEKRTAWENRPRPFPEAKMASAALEKQMRDLLQDRGWKVDNLVIVDKDWWVLKGEYRYLHAAVLSGDGDGPFWSQVSFRQHQTLGGYGPTEFWEAGKKIRLP